MPIHKLDPEIIITEPQPPPPAQETRRRIGNVMPVALRYTFEFNGTAVRILRQRRLDKQTAPSYAWEGADGESGFWVELRDAVAEGALSTRDG